MKYTLIFVLLLSACGVNAPNAGGGTVGPVKTFVKEDGTFLYFMGPVYFKSNTGKHQIAIDYSYNHQGTDEVVCNFTLKSPSLSTFNFDNLTLSSAQNSSSCNSAELFYKEVQGKSFVYRYSTKFKADQWLAFMKDENQALLLNGMQFLPGKKYKKIMSAINNQVIFAIN